MCKSKAKKNLETESKEQEAEITASTKLLGSLSLILSLSLTA
jgi:hypothetical protein